MASKTVKCQYPHCQHASREIPREEAVQVGRRYMHKDCAKDSANILQIRDYYYQHISRSVVMKNLIAVIHNIIFVKHVDSDYLLFALKYAVDHRIQINAPYGLHYLADNSKIKAEWQKSKSESIMKKAEFTPVKIEHQTGFRYSAPKSTGFESLLHK